jgi:triosephosphate isomerase
MNPMRKLLIANWKMNPVTVKEAVALARASDAKGVVIAAPFPFLPAVKRAVQRAAVGAQDAFWEKKGAYTGEVSPVMLAALEVPYVIIGHSERRALGETDEAVAKKVAAAFTAGLKVVLCVGEPLSVRRKGFRVAQRFVERQLLKDLRGIGNPKFFKPDCLFITYEPIWAISTSRDRRDETPADAAAMARFLGKVLLKRCKTSIKVLYGGSVNAANVKPFLARKELGGALVGGASLKADEFRQIIRIASRRR